MKRCLAILCSTLLASCTPVQQYVRSDRATFEAIAPEYRKYVEQDAGLADEQKARRFRLLDSWQVRIQAAEAGK